MTKKVFDIDNSRSYVSERKLVQAIEAKFGKDVKYITVCNRLGRFTAIFPISMNPNIMPIHIAHCGWMVVG